VHERIDLAHGVIAGEHGLTIQLLRDIDSLAERGIVFHLATSTGRDTAGPPRNGQQHYCCRVGCGADPEGGGFPSL
jgi:hypothetical protein